MKKMNILLVVGACLVFAGNASAMELRSGTKVEGEAVVAAAEKGVLASLAADLAAEAAAVTDLATVAAVAAAAATPASTETEAPAAPASAVIPAAPAVTPAGWRFVSWFRALSPTNVRTYLAAQWAKVPSKAAFKTWHAKMRAKGSFRMMENALGAAAVAVLTYQAWIYAHAQCGGDAANQQALCRGVGAVDGFGAAVAATASGYWASFTQWLQTHPDAAE